MGTSKDEVRAGSRCGVTDVSAGSESSPCCSATPGHLRTPLKRLGSSRYALGQSNIDMWSYGSLVRWLAKGGGKFERTRCRSMILAFRYLQTSCITQYMRRVEGFNRLRTVGSLIRRDSDGSHSRLQPMIWQIFLGGTGLTGTSKRCGTLACQSWDLAALPTGPEQR